jgi:hypothetical protein
LSPTVGSLLKQGVLLNRHHTYMWCSPTRRSFITGRYIVHITGEQAGTDTNLTPLQFTILSEKLAAANYENHFLGKGHMGWQTTDHLLVNRGFASHMGYLGGSESYKWGRHDASDDPNPLTGSHDMWHNSHPGIDIAATIGYSTSFYAMQAVDRIRKRDLTKNFWLHVAFQVCQSPLHTRIARARRISCCVANVPQCPCLGGARWPTPLGDRRLRSAAAGWRQPDCNERLSQRRLRISTAQPGSRPPQYYRCADVHRHVEQHPLHADSGQCARTSGTTSSTTVSLRVPPGPTGSISLCLTDPMCVPAREEITQWVKQATILCLGAVSVATVHLSA